MAALSKQDTGQRLKPLPFAYGASFTRQVFPEAPAREGCYVRWDRTDLTGLRFDTVVTAVYEPYVTALACAAQRDGRPVFLVRGAFTEEDVLGAEPAESGGESGAAESWFLSVPADGQTGHWSAPDLRFASGLSAALQGPNSAGDENSA